MCLETGAAELFCNNLVSSADKSVIFFYFAYKLMCFDRHLITGNSRESCLVFKLGAIKVGTSVVSNNVRGS